MLGAVHNYININIIQSGQMCCHTNVTQKFASRSLHPYNYIQNGQHFLRTNIESVLLAELIEKSIILMKF